MINMGKYLSNLRAHLVMVGEMTAELGILVPAWCTVDMKHPSSYLDGQVSYKPADVCCII